MLANISNKVLHYSTSSHCMQMKFPFRINHSASTSKYSFCEKIKTPTPTTKEMVAEPLVIPDESTFGVPECFDGKNVFITGATGFMGKVLLEKLLRSCPGIKKIYILARPKRGLGLQERLDFISGLPLFERLHEEHPGFFKEKVVAVAGDCMEKGLGLSAEDRQLLIEEVNCIYHAAATVKFDHPLKEAIFMNLRSTQDISQLALEMKHLHIMVHVSTAYAHARYETIEEKIYPPVADWRKVIHAAEEMSLGEMQLVMAHFMAGFPNTYTFTKGLAEQAIVDLLDGVVPCVIIRPSIVISSLVDPIPGWIDNFNGPVGLMTANSTGLVRINFLKEIRADVIPVDLAIKALINAVWFKLVMNKDREFQLKTTPHNCSASYKSYLTSTEVAEMAYSFAEEIAIPTVVWYPTLRHTENHTVYWLYFITLHLVPALFFDFVLKCLKYKPIVMSIHRRIFVAVIALKYFMTRSWVILNDSLYDVENYLLAKDNEAFGYNADDVDHREYFKKSLIGGMKYLLKEDISKIDQNVKRVKKLKYLDILVEVAFYSYLFYLVFIKWNIPYYLLERFSNYWEGLM